MKRILSVLLLCSVLPVFGQGSTAPSGGLEFRFGGISYSEDYWDDVSAAGNLGFVVWSGNGVVGLWLGGGAEAPTLKWNDGDHNLETDIVVAPVGVSLLIRAELFDGVALRAEGGARYTFMEVEDNPRYSDRRRGRFHYDHPYDYSSRDLDVDDTVLAICSLQLEFDIHPFVLGIGGGYQFDCIKPEIAYREEKFAEVDLSGAFGFVTFGLLF